MRPQKRSTCDRNPCSFGRTLDEHEDEERASDRNEEGTEDLKPRPNHAAIDALRCTCCDEKRDRGGTKHRAPAIPVDPFVLDQDRENHADTKDIAARRQQGQRRDPDPTIVHAKTSTCQAGQAEPNQRCRPETARCEQEQEGREQVELFFERQRPGWREPVQTIGLPHQDEQVLTEDEIGPAGKRRIAVRPSSGAEPRDGRRTKAQDRK